jgi:hypothetical protein
MVSVAALHSEALTELEQAFQNATKDRGKRSFFDPATGELQWVQHERAVMHDTVNRIRTRRGMSPADRADVERVEQSARGHSDYALKFALRCADLTLPD